jgi:hypothetical protein
LGAVPQPSRRPGAARAPGGQARRAHGRRRRRPRAARERVDIGPRRDAPTRCRQVAPDRGGSFTTGASSGRCVLIAARAGRRRGVTRGCATRALLGRTNAGLAPCLTRSSSLRRPMVVGRPPDTLPDRGRSARRGSERSARRSSSRARRSCSDSAPRASAPQHRRTPQGWSTFNRRHRPTIRPALTLLGVCPPMHRSGR